MSSSGLLTVVWVKLLLTRAEMTQMTSTSPTLLCKGDKQQKQKTWSSLHTFKQLDKLKEISSRKLSWSEPHPFSTVTLSPWKQVIQLLSSWTALKMSTHNPYGSHKLNKREI